MTSDPLYWKRPLTADEAELWAFAMREAKDLRRRGRVATKPESGAAPNAAGPARPEPSEPPPSAKRGKPATPPQPRKTAPPPDAPKSPPPLARFDERARRKLTRDADLIDARLDLHGMRQREAHSALTGFLLSCVSRGHRHVLVITGKGGAADTTTVNRDFFQTERGVLRRLVPQWLAEPELRGFVISYASASARHGGEGALYVRLRKTPARN